MIIHPISQKRLGVIEIFPSQRRPHLIRRDGEGVRRGQIYVRRGAETFIASRQEILEMAGDYWRPRIEEVRETLTKLYQGIEEDEREHYNIAEQACRRLYRTLPKIKRRKVLQDILVNKPDYFFEWFGEK